MSNLSVTYSLATPYSGVSIDATTGIVTVASTALPGTVNLKATYGALSGTATLTLPPTPTSVAFNSQNYQATIPANGNITLTAQAYVYDQSNTVMSSLSVTYSLVTPYTGVSINSTTGVVTVASTASPGTVSMKATYGALSGTATLTLTTANTSMNINTVSGTEYYVVISASDITSFNSVTYTLTYNANLLTLVDFAAQTYALETGAGVIPGTGLTILSHANGVLKFTFDRTIPSGKVWDGVMTVVKFQGKGTGTANVSIS